MRIGLQYAETDGSISPYSSKSLTFDTTSVNSAAKQYMRYGTASLHMPINPACYTMSQLATLYTLVCISAVKRNKLNGLKFGSSAGFRPVFGTFLAAFSADLAILAAPNPLDEGLKRRIRLHDADHMMKLKLCWIRDSSFTVAHTCQP